MEIEEYIQWKKEPRFPSCAEQEERAIEKGYGRVNMVPKVQPFDLWLGTHIKIGGKFVTLAEESMRVEGSIEAGVNGLVLLSEMLQMGS